MGNYKLSGAASADTVAIYKYGIKHFGQAPAQNYLKNLEAFLSELAERKELAKSASHFANGLYFYNYKAHVIFYNFEAENEIKIIRILGKRMDFIKHL